jgi:hypothetical protein
MGLDLKKSVVLITGSDPENKHFGTGFIIHQEGSITYLLTCAHVVSDVGGQEAVKAGGHSATVIASDSDNGFDLVVLRVEQQLESCEKLSLNISGNQGDSFITAGFYRPDKQILVQKLDGVLHDKIGVVSPDLGNSPAWHVEIQGEEYLLQSGYSGSPVVDKASGKVLGIINTRKEKGKKGLAISIEAIKKIWGDMPSSLHGDLEITKSSSFAKQSISDPLMNFEKELDAFNKIVTNQDAETRLICVYGAGGTGKTRLLQEYKNVASKNAFKILSIPLGPQVSIENCLNQIVCCFGINKFSLYNEIKKSGRPVHLTRAKEEQWHQDLTWQFISDLSNYTHAPRLAIFFDQCEKADPAFKKWLSGVFLSTLISQPLIVVVAGREELEQKPSWQGQRHFPLEGVTVDWYHRYVETFNLEMAPSLIEEFHKLLHGRPKEFVEYVKSQAMTGGVG